ncbi:DNA repair protein RecN, partial [Microbacterium arborescens]
MIEEMRLRGLGVIAEATLPMGPGFTAITGETGAGKTMVVTGLGLLLGQRADSGAVRAGAPQASVDGVWIVDENGPVAERVREAGGDVEPIGGGRSELYLGRVLSSEGRSRASVGGRPAPAAVLAELAEQLIVVHGQSDQLRLKSATAQRDALDRFGGPEIVAARDRYRAAYEAWRAVDAELTQLDADRDARRREADDLRARIADIEAVAPQPGEDAVLAERAEKLANVEELRAAAATAHDALSNDDELPDAVSLLAEARRAIERSATSDAALAAFVEPLADLGYRAADLVTGLSAYLADLDESGPQELAAVEERRAALNGLLRAHGTLDEALALLESGSARLMELDDDGDRIERLRAQRDELGEALDAAAADLTAARTA